MEGLSESGRQSGGGEGRGKREEGGEGNKGRKKRERGREGRRTAEMTEKDKKGWRKKKEVDHCIRALIHESKIVEQCIS